MKISARWVKGGDSIELLMWGHLGVGVVSRIDKTWYASYRDGIYSTKWLSNFATAEEAKRAVEAALARLLFELEDPGVSLKEFNELGRIAKFGPQKVMDDYDY